MTTIVYRDGVLAVDSKATLGGDWFMAPEVSKIAEVNGPNGPYLMAISGVIGARERLVEFIKRGVPLDAMPDMKDATGVLISCKGDGKTALILSESGWHRTATEPYLAYGTGTPVALGALHHGATAEEAVAAAIAHDTCSGGRVISMRIGQMASNNDAIPQHKRLAMGQSVNSAPAPKADKAPKAKPAKAKPKGK